jgi:hypothetical protein
MKNRILAMIASLVMIAVSGPVAARTQPANVGTARVGTQANLFNYSFINGSVTATGNADWASGMVFDNAGFKLIRLAARAAAAGAQVRVVSTDFFGNVVFVAPFQPIPVNVAFQTLTFANIPLAAFGTIVIDAIMNAGASIGTIDYNP